MFPETFIYFIYFYLFIQHNLFQLDRPLPNAVEYLSGCQLTAIFYIMLFFIRKLRAVSWQEIAVCIATVSIQKSPWARALTVFKWVSLTGINDGADRDHWGLSINFLRDSPDQIWLMTEWWKGLLSLLRICCSQYSRCDLRWIRCDWSSFWNPTNDSAWSVSWNWVSSSFHESRFEYLWGKKCLDKIYFQL